MLRRFLRTASLVSLAALAVLSIGCGNDNKPPDTDNRIEQTTADDIVQMLAAMAATDSGGWLTEVQFTFQDHAWSPPTALGGRTVQTRDRSFRRGSVDWSLNYVYYDTTLVEQADLDSRTGLVAYRSAAAGRIPLAPFQGFTGSGIYGHAVVPPDTLEVKDLRDTTISFSGFCRVDSALITITNGTATRHYYLDNVVEYALGYLRGGSWPASGEAQIDAFVDLLDTPVRGDRITSYDVVLAITFDGDENVMATLAPNVPDPATVYRYQINLRTGAIQRAP